MAGSRWCHIRACRDLPDVLAAMVGGPSISVAGGRPSVGGIDLIVRLRCLPSWSSGESRARLNFFPSFPDGGSWMTGVDWLLQIFVVDCTGSVLEPKCRRFEIKSTDVPHNVRRTCRRSIMGRWTRCVRRRSETIRHRIVVTDTVRPTRLQDHTHSCPGELLRRVTLAAINGNGLLGRGELRRISTACSMSVCVIVAASRSRLRVQSITVASLSEPCQVGI